MKNHSATYGQTHNMDWSSEVKAAPGNGRAPSSTGLGGMEQDSPDTWRTDRNAISVLDAANETSMPSGPQTLSEAEMNQLWPNIENNLPNDMIESPTTMEEVYRGSMKSLLLRNVGNYVVATFLIGTQTTVSWEGILYDVGNDYIAIYQSGRDQYIVSDLYSLKYVEFYDTRRRELCDSLLTAQEPMGNSQRN